MLHEQLIHIANDREISTKYETTKMYTYSPENDTYFVCGLLNIRTLK